MNGTCGDAACETGSNYKHYGPPGCQRLVKSVNADLMDKKTFIQSYFVSYFMSFFKLSDSMHEPFYHKSVFNRKVNPLSGILLQAINSIPTT